ncbi:hypothetical protein [Pseudonocardia alaniniphila]|uniref:Uncharacterized protein n=1 Tax=Pseudonocardia alaniniphila TaxID=75291 RepID=A0ABS9TNE8_9PSEU|nr:hypothetical protein [Pseudonocardia alaniniphila]MCH6169806.1 hypothetical protein [Pseudonocardia alaniniphila]
MPADDSSKIPLKVLVVLILGGLATWAAIANPVLGVGIGVGLATIGLLLAITR